MYQKHTKDVHKQLILCFRAFFTFFEKRIRSNTRFKKIYGDNHVFFQTLANTYML